MNDRLKKALNNIQAEEALKNSTRVFLYKKTKGYTRVKAPSYRYLIPVAACLLLVILGWYRLYFTPTVEISIDINPSIELGVNRFNKIISIHGYNLDGENLADSFDIKYLDYIEAINEILTNETVRTLLSNNEIMTISVIGSDDAQSARVLSEIESCTAEETNTYCYYANSDGLEEAHAMGLSYGKYRAYLELQALDPTITIDEIKNMTMREIRDLINALSVNNNVSPDTDSDEEHNGHGTGNQFRHRNRHGADSQSDSKGG